MNGGEQLLERIDAAVQAAQFPLMDALLQELRSVLHGSDLPVHLLESVLIRLQQSLSQVQLNRSRLHHELATLERCKTYLRSNRNGAQTLVLSA